MVPAARPVRSATSLMARPFTARSPYLAHGVHTGGPLPRYGSACAGDPIRVYRPPVSGAMDPSSREPDPVLVAGASGYVGSFLVSELLRRGHRVRALARRPQPGRLPPAVDVRRGDAVSGAGLAEALAGCRTAYYLIHSMGRDSGPTEAFARRDLKAAV